MDTAENTPASKPTLKWIVRPMKNEDIEKCLIIWSRVELTEARQTVSSCLTFDPMGFYVAELEGKPGEILGMCAGVMTRPDTAFIGFYGVEPAYQGIGIGRELWSSCLSRLEPTTNVGLYGVPSMTEKYKKSGFKLEDSIRMIIYESERHGKDKLNLDALKDIDELGSSCRLELINGETNKNILKKLYEFDQIVHRYSREKLLKIYLTGDADDIPLTFAIVKYNNNNNNNKNSNCVHYQTTTTCCADKSDNVGDTVSGNQVTTTGGGANHERKLSCCAKPMQEAIIEDEALSTTTKTSLSISTGNLGELHTPPLRSISPIDIPSPSSVSPAAAASPSKLSAAAAATLNEIEILGYGCIRHDNNSGGMIGPIYADSSDLCEVLLKNLIQKFDLTPGSIYSVMALNSNHQASKIMTKVGFIEIDQCTRMFTKFIPAATFSKIYYVHSPNFTLV